MIIPFTFYLSLYTSPNPVPAVLPPVAHVFPAVEAVFLTVTDIFPAVAYVFAAVPAATLVLGIAHVFPAIPYILATVADIFPAVEAVFPAVEFVLQAIKVIVALYTRLVLCPGGRCCEHADGEEQAFGVDRSCLFHTVQDCGFLIVLHKDRPELHSEV
jgi:hypothetical protein